ncbi:Hypothetical predicted protein [Marmota monax]|uniref:Uncharacterized protein n=1 Tax=Marmota monax TaxID=9995 RepID=A0A5E4CJ94_MARMO|nr:hypothetical protein GHT09_005950 [Marmota monax]VTJ81390.1 Hypothetical predicted protein [Marmota monax]
MGPAQTPTLTREQNASQSWGPQETLGTLHNNHPHPCGSLTCLFPASGTIPCPFRRCLTHQECGLCVEGDPENSPGPSRKLIQGLKRHEEVTKSPGSGLEPRGSGWNLGAHV